MPLRTPRLTGLGRVALLLVVGAAVLLPVLLPAGRAASGGAQGPSVRTRYVYYEVRGASVAQLRADLDDHRPADVGGHRFDAITRWWVTWRYTYSSRAGACAVGTVSVSVEVEHRLPHWQPPRGVSPDLIARWRRYMRALRLHEGGHAQNGVTTARSILAGLRGLRAPTCARLEAEASALGSREIARGNARDAAYDRRTEHGAAQGAVFP